MAKTWRSVCVAVGLYYSLSTAPGIAETVFSNGFEAGLCGWTSHDCVYCSPLDPVIGCGEDSQCIPQFKGTPICSYPAGSGAQDDFCVEFADCGSQYACVDAGQGTRCHLWCQRPSGTCPLGNSCLGFTPAVLIGATEWGVCN